MFMTTIQTMASGQYRNHILYVSREVDVLIRGGKDQAEALECMLGFYATSPVAQAQIREVISAALGID